MRQYENKQLARIYKKMEQSFTLIIYIYITSVNIMQINENIFTLDKILFLNA